MYRPLMAVVPADAQWRQRGSSWQDMECMRTSDTASSRPSDSLAIHSLLRLGEEIPIEVCSEE